MPLGDQTLAQQGYTYPANVSRWDDRSLAPQETQNKWAKGMQIGWMGPGHLLPDGSGILRPDGSTDRFGSPTFGQIPGRAQAPTGPTRQQYQQMRYMPNPMMGFNPLMGGYGGGTGRFDGSQMPQFAGPDPAMGGPDRGRMSFFGTPGFGLRGPDNGPAWGDIGGGMGSPPPGYSGDGSSLTGGAPYHGSPAAQRAIPDYRELSPQYQQMRQRQMQFGGGYPGYGGGGYQQPSQGYGNIAALFSQLFGGGGMGGSPNYSGGGMFMPGDGQYGGGSQQNPYGIPSSQLTQMFGPNWNVMQNRGGNGAFEGRSGQPGSPFNSYNPFGNMIGSSGPNPLMGGFSSPGGGMFGGQGFGGYGFGSNMPNFTGLGNLVHGAQREYTPDGGYFYPANPMTRYDKNGKITAV